MTWLFSKAMMEAYGNSPSLPEQAAASSVGTSLDGEQFAQLNVSPTQHPFWRKGKMMDASQHSLFGQTSQVLTAGHGRELLMSFLEAFPVRTLAQPEKAPALMESEAASGLKVRGLLAKWSRHSACWKTAQCSLLGDSEEFLETWPKWGLMRAGECWELEKPDLFTSGTESGYSLPTPSGVNGGTNNTMGRVDEWGGSSNPLRGTVIGSMCLPEFEELVMGWPVMWTALTPFAMDKFQEWSSEHGRN